MNRFAKALVLFAIVTLVDLALVQGCSIAPQEDANTASLTSTFPAYGIRRNLDAGHSE